MAQVISCRMSRLIIGARQLISTTASTMTPNFSPQKVPYRWMRCLSSVIPVRRIEASGLDYGATSTLEAVPPQDKAVDFAAFAHANRHLKVKPFIIKRRIKKLRTYIGAEKGVRHSPWRMNLVCQFAAGLTVPEALKQLMFCQKRMAPLVAKVIRDTAKADRRDGLQPSQLEVAECFSTHGSHLKRIKIMGRGRSGKKHRRHSHIRLVLREIDFPTKLLQATSVNQKRKWLEALKSAREDYEKASVERKELAELEAMASQLEEDARKKEEGQRGKI
ncbi:hypothetical protein ACHAXA_009623 [Cyclostephanos tholiformis]|uniref:Ribosomal protein L22 n=1 Tax=Cyclostephanos tholiformis TaxID=382380 RepID=A0ABD3R0N5_9STRA